jgi:hypothetical protein
MIEFDEVFATLGRQDRGLAILRTDSMLDVLANEMSACLKTLVPCNRARISYRKGWNQADMELKDAS